MKKLNLIVFFLWSIFMTAQTDVTLNLTVDDQGTGIADLDLQIVGIGDDPDFYIFEDIKLNANGTATLEVEVPESMEEGMFFVRYANCFGSKSMVVQQYERGIAEYDLSMSYCDSVFSFDSLCVAFILPLGNDQLTAIGFGKQLTYKWNTGETTRTILASDSSEYCVTVTDADRCVAESCITNPIGGGGFDSCYSYIKFAFDSTNQDSVFTLVAHGDGAAPFTYIWSNGETTQSIDVEEDGIYCVIITNADGCVSEACEFVFGNGGGNGGGGFDSCYSYIEFAFDSTNQDSVFTLVAHGDGTAPFTYIWSTGETTQSIDVDEDSIYCVTVTDADGCVSEACELVFVNGGGGGNCDTCSVFIFMIQDSMDDNWVLTAETFGVGPFTYEWDNGETTQTITVDEEGKYCVTVYSEGDTCTAKACIEVKKIKGSIYGTVLYNATKGSFNSIDVELYIKEQNDFVLFKTVNAEDSIPNGGFLSFGFIDLEKGDYLIKVNPQPIDGDFLPTYFGDVEVWDEAEVIGLDVIFFAEINLIAKNGIGGNGKSGIKGKIVDGAGFTNGSSESGETPLVNVAVILMNDFDEILELSWTNSNGEYQFDGLAEGNYHLTFDVMNIKSDVIDVILSKLEVKVVNIDVANGITNTGSISLEEIKMWPNPVTTILHISLPDNMKEEVILSIVDMKGIKVISDATINQDKAIINVSHLIEGVYIVQLRSANNVISKRVIKN